ncbi:4-hydroxy-tetrahydrodipicolinate synthase, chloroplastic-like [Telopea speciosissima]|uniref:4-hydroxy-tetrahydrodipicolinate synthase, chloroplastic-like n=1 Tax=Telopea speciosissima TaxID=54955 RepID=UPI001CC670CC|nr:4-hydroxy-tetrahydrodipicolinate synthase, chloroplastic-like [Telopea speciosissima]
MTKRGSRTGYSIVQCLPLLKRILFKKIGNGISTDFWNDPWIPTIKDPSIPPSLNLYFRHDMRVDSLYLQNEYPENASSSSSKLHLLKMIVLTSIEEIRSLRLMTAVKTPYLPDGKIDLEAYDALIHMQILGGADSVLVGGSTGEGQLMSWEEHIMLIAHTVNCFGGLIKVIGNTGSNSTKEAIEATEHGFAVGMDAALHINPFYCRTSNGGMVAHFEAVLPFGPIIIYNVPTRSGQDIPPAVIRAIAKHPNLAGVKECMGFNRIKEYTDEGIVTWTGIDKEGHDARLGYGAIGVSSVAGNLIPRLMSKLMFEAENPLLNSKLAPLFEWLHCEPSPIPTNTALMQLGVVRPVFRLPYLPLSRARREEFVSIVKELGRENFVGDRDVQVLEDDDFVVVHNW